MAFLTIVNLFLFFPAMQEAEDRLSFFFTKQGILQSNSEVNNKTNKILKNWPSVGRDSQH